MKSLLISLLMLLPSGNGDAGSKYLDDSFSTYDSLQKKIFALAEPGFAEYESSKAIADHLSDAGFTIEWGVGDLPTAFVATYGKGKPVIGLLGEYDALPGMSQDTVAYVRPLKEGAPGHTCGHNLIGTATAASAVAISRYLAEGHEGTVKYFGCPAEEGGGGKHYMTVAGCFDSCDAVFDWHPGNMNEVSLSPWSANMRVNFTFHGISAHAGGAPWKGRSALDAVEAFNCMMNMMREHVPDGSRIHYIISDGGQAPNAVPARAQVIYYFRHPKSSVVRDIFERALKAAHGAAEGTGTTMEYEIINASYEKCINRTLAEVMHANLQKVGGIKLDERERNFVREIRKNRGDERWEDTAAFGSVSADVTNAKGIGSSSDVGHVSQKVPLASLRYVTMPAGTSLHTWAVAAVSGSTIGTKALLNVARIFYLTAVDLYSDPQKVKDIRAEFDRVKGKDYRFVPLMDRRPPLDMNASSAPQKYLNRFAVPGVEKPVYYDAPHALGDGGDCSTAVILIHGWGSGIKQNGAQAGLQKRLPGAYVIAPLFPRESVMKKNGMKPDGRALWNASWSGSLTTTGEAADDWRAGGDTEGVSLSSYEVIDRIMEILSDRRLYPDLRRIVLCGFSAGGQFTDRYAAVGRALDGKESDIRVDYLAMSPSTWLYLDRKLKWHYGIAGMPRYCSGMTESSILKNLQKRHVWRACGDRDVTSGGLDRSGEAMAHGENRLDRFTKYMEYVKSNPKWNASTSFFTLEGLAHESGKAYATDTVTGILSGSGTVK